MKKFKNYGEFRLYVDSTLKISVHNCVSGFSRYQDSDYMYDSACTGGMSGGNCWGGKARSFHGEEPTYDDFNRLVSHIFEFESANEIERRKNEMYDMIWDEEDSEHEYYGNKSYYKYLILDLKQYYEKIIDVKQVRKEKIEEVFGDETV